MQEVDPELFYDYRAASASASTSSAVAPVQSSSTTTGPGGVIIGEGAAAGSDAGAPVKGALARRADARRAMRWVVSTLAAEDVSAMCPTDVTPAELPPSALADGQILLRLLQ